MMFLNFLKFKYIIFKIGALYELERYIFIFNDIGSNRLLF
jgi:hypothetical protein